MFLCRCQALLVSVKAVSSFKGGEKISREDEQVKTGECSSFRFQDNGGEILDGEPSWHFVKSNFLLFSVAF